LLRAGDRVARRPARVNGRWNLARGQELLSLQGLQRIPIMTLDWLADPTAWFGLGTLIVLEIVLGIDNLVFIAILTDRLPPQQRQRARLTGLGLALVMRLGLLAGIAWIASLTAPLVDILGKTLSGRDLILIGGGLFLLFKATSELHARLEASAGSQHAVSAPAVFWQVIAQIIVLDMIFSLDSVITAVGMVDDVSLMMAAVIAAVLVMMLASRPLMDFVGAHPTVVILCLGFLLMIGFSLAVEGLGFHVPKGYLYAAIAFSILIEALNQIAWRNRHRRIAAMNPRERAAAAVLRLLGSRTPVPAIEGVVAPLIRPDAAAAPFQPQERAMVHRVITLADRPAHSIMTPRAAVVWLDIGAPQAELRRLVLTTGRSRFPVACRTLDDARGIALTRDLLAGLLARGRIEPARALHPPLTVPASMPVLDLLERWRDSPVQMALLVGENGRIEGIVTADDALRAITALPAEPASPGPRTRSAAISP
jgi:predicted tellurium resistance membrane protein TerC